MLYTCSLEFCLPFDSISTVKLLQIERKSLALCISFSGSLKSSVDIAPASSAANFETWKYLVENATDRSRRLFPRDSEG